MVSVREAFLHCAKALIRAKLWHPESRIERSALPSYGTMLKDQIDTADSLEHIEAAIADNYTNRLY